MNIAHHKINKSVENQDKGRGNGGQLLEMSNRASAELMFTNSIFKGRANLPEFKNWLVFDFRI